MRARSIVLLMGLALSLLAIGTEVAIALEPLGKRWMA